MRKFLAYFTVIVIVIISIVACESDFENIGVDLVDNDNLNTDKATYEVSAYTKNVLKSRVENTPINALGIYNPKNDGVSKYGILKAGIATQLSIPTTDIDFGQNPIIDEVILDIPYNSTKDSDINDNGSAIFNLNNIYGNQDTEYTLTISRLNTFLNFLDPEDPTKPKKYYSDRSYNKLEELYSDTFKPNNEDTIIYIKRNLLDPTIQTLSFYYDTIQKSDKRPSIKLPLDETFFTNEFVNAADPTNFESQEKFNQFFNGLLFEVEEIGDDGSVMMLNFANATTDGRSTVTIYYTNEIPTDETITDSEGTIISETDLNGDGDTIDEDVIIKTKQSMVFGFNGIRTNTFNRDYTNATIENALDNPTENKKLFVQGAQGSLVTLDAFNNIDLNVIRAENWLINEANIICYVDQNASDDEVPTRLFLYKIDENADDINDNAQILDILTLGEAVIDGNLQKENDDDDENTTEGPVKYRFRITDYLSEILENEDATEPVRLGIKAFHSTDLPNLQNPADTLVRDFSWDPRGVTLYGNDYIPTDVDYDKRLKLEIYYTKIND